MQPSTSVIDRPSSTLLPTADPIPALVANIAAIVKALRQDEPVLCSAIAAALAPAIGDPAWIPEALRLPALTSYRRELLHEASDGSFSIGCFVWGPGQQTPIHDHRSWGVIGSAVGTLEAVNFCPGAGGLVAAPATLIQPGTCSWVDPAGANIHRVGALDGETAVSIHVYGARFDRVCWRQYQPDGTVLSG